MKRELIFLVLIITVCACLAARASRVVAKPADLRPTDLSVSGVHLGMTRTQVRWTLLLEHCVTPPYPDGVMLCYDRSGIFCLDNGDHVTRMLGQTVSCPLGDAGMGSSRARVRLVLGEPDEMRTIYPYRQDMYYRKIGLTVSLWSGKVDSFNVLGGRAQ